MNSTPNDSRTTVQAAIAAPRRFADALVAPENAVGARSAPITPSAGLTLAAHRAPAHEFHRGVADELLVVAQRNISAGSVRFDLGWGWREHVCRAPRPVYVVPAQAPARWQLDGESQCVYLALQAASVERLLGELGVPDAAGCLWTLSMRGFEEALVHEMVSRLWEQASMGAGAAASLLADSYRVAIVHALACKATGLRASPRARAAARLSAPQLRRTLGFVDAHLGAALSVESIAAVAGVSAFHFSRLFRAATGLSPHAFVLQQRIERAAERLRASDEPAAAIGRALGFPSASHFSRTFAARMGCSPQRYRQQWRR